jgi:hypothetical protein
MPISSSSLRETRRRFLFSFNLFIFNNLRIQSFCAAFFFRSAGRQRRGCAPAWRQAAALMRRADFSCLHGLFYRPAGLAWRPSAIFSFAISKYPSASVLGRTSMERPSQIPASG